MILQLTYSEKVQYQTRAVFIRSADPQVWFEQMDDWGIDPLTLSCFAVPKSKKNLEIAGLFVLFPLGHVPRDSSNKILELRYGAVTPRFFIPIQATLFPQISSEELQKILLFDLQIFHPSIGMVGFNKSNKISLEDLLVLPDCPTQNWDIAEHAPAPFPPLHRIQIPKLLDEDFLDVLKEGIETKDLEDIPGADKAGKGESFMNKIQREALQKMLKSGKMGTSMGGNFGGTGGLGDLGALGGMFAALGGMLDGNGGAGSGHKSRGGFRAWAMKRLAELEKKRHDEIDRLMDLFEKNPEEALKYALPLDGTYMGRGDAPPSSSLGRRTTNFSLGGLGGGGRIDGWNLGDRYFELRKKYQTEAKRLLDLKQYRKAAYIYAQLLSDFSSAANALVQGKYYREAAVLYQKHLNNIPAAADCLEKGGLLLEAIDLYIELGKNEKVGDLYQQLGQTEQARIFYQKVIDSALVNNDYLEVARLQKDKLQEYKTAHQSLLTGWQQSKQSEACLNEYFNWMRTEETAEVQEEIERVYEHYTPAYRKNSFLKVLLQVNQNYRNDAILETTRPMAYEIISEQIQQKNVGNVHFLRQFMPEDRLIGSDCSRYITKFHVAQKLAAKPIKEDEDFKKVLYLGEKIKWKAFASRHDQFLALGTVTNRLQLVRGNKKGHLNYYTWELDSPNLETIDFNIVQSISSPNVFIQSSQPVALSTKKLAKSVHFYDDLWVRDLAKLPNDLVGVTMSKSADVIALSTENHHFKFSKYNENLELRDVYTTRLEAVPPYNPIVNGWCNLVYHQETYYYGFRSLLCSEPENKRKGLQFELNTAIRKFCVNSFSSDLEVLLSTSRGYVFVKSENQHLQLASNFFDVGFIAVDMLFINKEYLAIAGKYEVKIYTIPTSEDKRMVYKKSIPVQKPIVALSLYAKRSHVAVLTEDGKMEIFDFVR